jgi:hypothetical protein
MASKTDPTTDVSPADQAQEMARLRERIRELEAPKSPDLAVTSSTEIDAGVDESGRQWWYYKIDLPPSGGDGVTINNHWFYHGQQYKIGTDTLRSLKEAVHRSWTHDNSIRGNNENFYRRETAQKIGSRA